MHTKTILTALAAATLAISASSAEEQKGTIYLAANAHLDTQWQWTVQRVIGEFLPNTLFQNFRLLEEYPDYKMSFEGAVKYQWFKEYYPEQYEILKKYIAEGRWYTAGGWDANDWNVPSVESNIRNILLGEEFYKKEFGKKSIDIMLPDCFGFGYTLPTVAAHCGLIAFHTQKLQWRNRPFYADGRKYPFEFGIWQGIDGSRILASLNSSDYGWSPTSDITAEQHLIDKVNSSAVGAAMRYYGTKSTRLHGDQGGSPIPKSVRAMDESIRKGSPYYDLRFATVADIFRDHEDLLTGDVLPIYDGELLMDVHGTGVYTANSDTKVLNRRCEQLGYAAEAGAVMADWLGAVSYPHEFIGDAYRRFIWHQFHDDLTGTSIKEAYPFTWNDMMLAQNQFANTLEASVGGFASAMDTRVKSGSPMIVFNPVSSRNRDIVTINVDMPSRYAGVIITNPSGKTVKSQIISREGDRATIAFAADDRSLGLGVYGIRFTTGKQTAKTSLSASGRTVSNSIYSVTVGETGDIVSIIDKRHGRELVAPGKSFALQVFEENTSDSWPAWEILKSTIDKTPVSVDREVKVSIESTGPLMAVLRVDRKYGESTFTQRITLYDGAEDDRIDIRNDIDWRSRRTLLKAAFPVSFSAPQASYDLGIGHIQRGNNTDIAYEVPAQEWADMTATDGSYGVTVMTDSRYGWDKPDDNTIRLTLLHSPTADRGYRDGKDLDIGRHTFTYSIVGHAGALDGALATTAADILNQRKSAFITDSHKGFYGKEFSMAATTSPAIRIKALKKAEDGDGIIVRVYELSGNDASGKISFPAGIVSAEETNGIEERIGDADFESSGNSLNVNIPRFSIKTYRVRLTAPPTTAQPIRYTPIYLPFDKLAITTNNFSAFGHMDREWHSYAAELIPSEIVYKGIPFTTGEPDYDNAVSCRGQEIDIPAGSTGIYLLLASASEDTRATFNAGIPTDVNAPAWSGFFGGAYWDAAYDAFLREGNVACIGSHRHDSARRDDIYVHSYMYMAYIPVSSGATSLTLPDAPEVTLLAATASLDPLHPFTEVSDSITRF